MIPSDVYLRCLQSAALLLFLSMIATGCSVSYSLEKSSDSISESLDSISASFDSFSDSSTGAEADQSAELQRLYDDVSALTAAWDDNLGDALLFERQLSDVALGYGIADWEGDSRIFHAIGSGLRQAGVQEAEIGEQPFLQTETMLRRRDLIYYGYLGS